MNPEEIVIMEAIQNVIFPRYHALQKNPTKENMVDLHDKTMRVLYAAWRYSSRCSRWGCPVSDEVAELIKSLEKVASETMRLYNQLYQSVIVISMRRIG
jgi:hypothetical protein